MQLLHDSGWNVVLVVDEVEVGGALLFRKEIVGIQNGGLLLVLLLLLRRLAGLKVQLLVGFSEERPNIAGQVAPREMAAIQEQ